MLLSVALSTASRSRGLADASPPPRRAATVISRMSRLKILPRLASVAALRCLMLAHLLWPAMARLCDEPQIITGPFAGVRLKESLLLQELREHLEPNLAIVDLEHALLDVERQRQQLGEPIAHPGCVVQHKLGRKVLAPDASDQQFE